MIARLYGKQKEIDEPVIIVTESSFHGRTLATMSATGLSNYWPRVGPSRYMRIRFPSAAAFGAEAGSLPLLSGAASAAWG